MELQVHIKKRLGEFCLEANLSSGDGLLSLLGASGCGKTLTLKCIAGIERPDEGRIILGSRVLFDSDQKINLPPQKRRVGYMFQDYALFPHMTVRQNILAGMGRKPIVLLGFGSTADVFYEAEFRQLGAEVIITTEDGSRGVKGFVTDGMDGVEYDSLFVCGPERMLQAVDEKAPQDVPGQMSFERRMGCGFGACMGCSCRTKYGSKRICVEGPVLERSEIVW